MRKSSIGKQGTENGYSVYMARHNRCGRHLVASSKRALVLVSQSNLVRVGRSSKIKGIVGRYGSVTIAANTSPITIGQREDELGEKRVQSWVGLSSSDKGGSRTLDDDRVGVSRFRDLCS